MQVVDEVFILGILSFLTLFAVQFSAADSAFKTIYLEEWEVAHVWLFAVGLGLAVAALHVVRFIKARKCDLASAMLLDDSEVLHFADQADKAPVWRTILAWPFWGCVHKVAVHKSASEYRVVDFVFRALNGRALEDELGEEAAKRFEFGGFMARVWEFQGIQIMHVNGLTWSATLVFMWSLLGLKAMHVVALNPFSAARQLLPRRRIRCRRVECGHAAATAKRNKCRPLLSAALSLTASPPRRSVL